MTQANSYVMRCSKCGTKNRIPADKVGMTAHCGKCKTAIQTQTLKIDHPLIITDQNFYHEVVKSPLPTLLECWAPWCGPCQMMEPFLKELAAKWKGRIRVGKLNVDENTRTASQFQVQSIPTLLIFDNGKLKNTLAGALPKHSIVQAMNPYL